MVLVPNRSCEHGGAQAPRRRRSDSGVSRPSTPGLLASLISTGTVTVVSPESAGAVGRPSLAASWFASSLSFRAGARLPHKRQSTPSATKRVATIIADGRRWRASRESVERREARTCKKAKAVAIQCMECSKVYTCMLAGRHDPRPVTIDSVHPGLMFLLPKL